MITGFRSILFKFVAFAVVAILLFLLLLNTMINSLPTSSRPFTAYFTSVSGLTPGSDVRVAGVRIGKVSDIQLVTNGGVSQTGIPKSGPNGEEKVAAVTFDVESSQAVYKTTKIKMLYQNLLGQRFLSLYQDTTTPGLTSQANLLGSGARILATETDPGFDLTQLLDGFRPLFQVLQPDQVNQLAGSIIQVLQGEGGSIENLLQQTNQLTNFLADRDQVVGQVLTNLTPVLNDFAGQGTQLASTVTSLRQLMDGLAADRSSIGDSITHLSTLITSTSDLIEQARTPATADVHLFRQVVETTNSEKTLLTKALGAFADAFGALGRASSYTNAVNIYDCSLTISLLGVPINLSGHAQGGPWTGVCR
jgi:phospholipid/cholesterol/gamma-HCH transport system substrate-binding protein